MYDMKPLIQKLRQHRKRLGINQTEFANRLGVSLATITRWERANMVYTPDLRQLSLMADMFGVTVLDLLTPALSGIVRTDEMTAEPETPMPADDAPDTPLIVMTDETTKAAAETAPTATEAPALAANLPDPPADTPPQEAARITKSKPWEPLGISRAWYYRLRQQGRLEEYIKSKN